MANVYATKSGNWSDTTVWNTGALPTSADDVYANNFTVAADTTTTVLSIRTTSTTGIAAGGGFTAVNGVTLTLTGVGVVAGSSVAFTSNLIAGQSFTIVGNVTGGSSNFISGVLINSGAGTLSINGTIYSGTGSQANGVTHNGQGSLTITGNVFGGNLSTVAGINHIGVSNGSSGLVTITGNVTGASNSGSSGDCGVQNGSNGSVAITGTVTGGAVAATNTGAQNNGSGSVTITGTITGGSVATGATNNSTGTLTHVGIAQASSAQAAIGGGPVGQITTLTGPLLSTDGSGGTAAASGVNPCTAARWFPADTALSSFEYRMRGATVSGSPSSRPARRLFLTDAYDATYPTAANVRSGTAYGPSSIYTGTCAVPAAASVVVGAAVDNTVGTAAITAATIRAAVGLASANLDTQLSGISSGISGLPSASAIASAVWAAATRTLTTAIDNSSTIAAAVWSYATGRTITGGTVDTLTNAPSVPSAATIASQVRTELTPELARVANCATTQEVDDIVEGALS